MQEDKVLDMLEKLFIELQDTKKVVEQNSKNINKIGIILENDVSRKFDVVFEFRDITNEKLERIESKIDDLNEKVETHDIKIKVIKGGNKKNKSI